jgi:hypothetical protein
VAPDAPVGPALNDALLEMALARIRRAPFAFAGLVLRDYLSLWMPFKQQQPVIARELNAYAAAHRPLPFQWLTFAVPATDTVVFRSSPIVQYVFPLVVLVGLVTAAVALAGTALAIRGALSSRALQIACVAALAAHGQLLFSATFAAGISRFMIAAWPAVIIATLTTTWWIVRRQ